MKSEILVGKPRVLLPRRLFAVDRALAWVGDRQRGGEHQNLADAPLGIGLQDHPPQARVQWQLREATAHVGDRALSVEGAEFLQQHHAVADTALQQYANLNQ